MCCHFPTTIYRGQKSKEIRDFLSRNVMPRAKKNNLANDWICDGCGDNIFGSESSCHKCKADKENSKFTRTNSGGSNTQIASQSVKERKSNAESYAMAANASAVDVAGSDSASVIPSVNHLLEKSSDQTNISTGINSAKFNVVPVKSTDNECNNVPKPYKKFKENFHAKKIIQSNKYIPKIKKKMHIEMPKCSCLPDSGCADYCINRSMLYECDPKNCPCTGTSICSNTKIQNHKILPVEVFSTTNKGFGVKTLQRIESGSFIIEYTGDVITEKQLKKRNETRYRNDIHHYSMSLGDGLVIDARDMGNLARLVNHSCQPNSEIQKWIVNGLPSLALFSLRDIEPEEEITFNYKFTPYNTNDKTICHCNESNCRKFLGIVGFEYKLHEKLN